VKEIQVVLLVPLLVLAVVVPVVILAPPLLATLVEMVEMV
jgi:hypothetical protein